MDVGERSIVVRMGNNFGKLFIIAFFAELQDNVLSLKIFDYVTDECTIICYF